VASDISRFLESEFFDAFNLGREDEAAIADLEYGVWSAILDERSCAWCSWADERTFRLSAEHPVPPVHFGCRCVIAYYSEDMLDGDDPEQMFLPWEDPPDDVMPPGTKGK
jgi:hypothetical protein